MAHRIPVTFLYPVLALPKGKAAQALGIGHSKLWLLCNLDDGDPRKIKTTSYGTIPVTELDRHLKAEINPHPQAG